MLNSIAARTIPHPPEFHCYEKENIKWEFTLLTFPDAVHAAERQHVLLGAIIGLKYFMFISSHDS